MFPALPKLLVVETQENFFEIPGGEDAEFFVFKTKAASPVPPETHCRVGGEEICYFADNDGVVGASPTGLSSMSP